MCLFPSLVMDGIKGFMYVQTHQVAHIKYV